MRNELTNCICIDAFGSCGLRLSFGDWLGIGLSLAGDRPGLQMRMVRAINRLRAGALVMGRQAGLADYLGGRVASRMDALTCSTDEAICSGAMTAGGARRMWSPLIPSTLPCMG